LSIKIKEREHIILRSKMTVWCIGPVSLRIGNIDYLDKVQREYNNNKVSIDAYKHSRMQAR